jgi:hypothetical protein
MADAASRWALLVSLALHVGGLTLSFGRPPRSEASKVTHTDFWAGNTFEVPELVGGEVAWASAASPAFETTSEINVEGADPSSVARSPAGPLAAVTTNPTAPSAPMAAPTAAPSDSDTPNAKPTASSTAAPSSTALAASSPRGKAKGARGRAEAGAAASANPGSEGSTGSASSGAFGAEGAAAGVRDLVRSFVRAIPIVASSDPVWATLPLGAAGTAEVTLGMNGEGKPFASEPVESAAPAHLRRLVHKTLSVMAGGRFAVPTSDAPAAEQKLRIAIALTQQEPPADRDVASGGAFGLRFEPADAHHVSRAFFTLASGRRVEVSVRQLSLH